MIRKATSRARALRRWGRALSPFVRKTLSGERGRLRRELESRTRIRSPHGIDELRKLELGGAPQWIRVRGEHRDNPLVLFLHGGPGFSWLPNYRAYQLPWERHFTVVHWDQRGAGKSHLARRHRHTLTVAQLVSDAGELIDHLCRRFAQPKLMVLGHSWGSYLGLRVARIHGEKLHAYVGMAQVVDFLEAARLCYRFALESAAADANDVALRELEALQPFPDDIAGIARKQPVWRKWMRYYVGKRYGFDHRDLHGHANLMATPEFSLADVYRHLKGTLVSQETLGAEAHFRSGPPPMRFDVPIFVGQGKLDWITPWQPARDYVARVEAPHKAFFTFHRSAHNPNETEPQTFLDFLLSTQPGYKF